MVVLVVGGTHVPAHGQAEVILLIGGEVRGAAHQAFAVADLNQVQHVVPLGGVAGEVVKVAEGLARVVELGDHRHGSAVGVEGDVLGGVDAGDLRAVAGSFGLFALNIQAPVGVGHQVVVPMHAGVESLVVQLGVVSGNHAVGVEGVGVAGAAGPGHLIAVHADEVVPLVVVFLGGGTGLLPLGGGAFLVLGQGGQIVVAGGGGGGGGIEVVGVVGDDDVVQIVYTVGMLIGLLQGAGAVGVFGGVGVDLAEVEHLAHFADEEGPVLGGGFAVGPRHAENHGVLALGKILGGHIGNPLVGNGAVHGFAVQPQGNGGIGACVGIAHGDLRPQLLAGTGVGSGGDRQNLRRIHDLHGGGGAVGLVPGVGAGDLQIQDRVAGQIRRGHDVGADLVVVGDLGGLRAGAVAVEPVFRRGGGDVADVVGGELDFGVSADGGKEAGVKDDGGVHHVAHVVAVRNPVEPHGVLVGLVGVVGVAAEHGAEELGHHGAGAPLGGLVGDLIAAGNGLQGPLGVLAFRVHQDQTFVVGGSAVGAHVVLGAGQILGAGLEGVVAVGDADLEDQAAVADVVVAQTVVAELGSGGQQIGLGLIRAGGLAEDGLADLVVDDDLVACHGHVAGVAGGADGAVGLGGGHDPELEAAGLHGGVGVTGEAALGDAKVGVLAPQKAGVAKIDGACHAGLVGFRQPFCSGVGNRVDQGERAVLVLHGQVLALDHQIVGAVAETGFEEPEHHGLFGQLLQTDAVGGGFRDGSRRKLVRQQVLTQNRLVAPAAGVDHAIAVILRHPVQEALAVGLFGGDGHGRKHGEHHDERQKQRKGL